MGLYEVVESAVGVVLQYETVFDQAHGLDDSGVGAYDLQDASLDSDAFQEAQVIEIGGILQHNSVVEPADVAGST